jgi:hypothetical protein
LFTVLVSPFPTLKKVRIKTEETFSNLSLEREREREKERNDRETHFFDRLLVLICELEGITQLRA